MNECCFGWVDLHPPVIRKQYGKDPDGYVVPVHHLPGGTRGTRTSAAPEVARAIYFYQLVPTPGPSTYSTNPSRSAYRPARMLPLLIRAAAARAGLFGIPVVLCWDLGGESPLQPRRNLYVFIVYRPVRSLYWW